MEKKYSIRELLKAGVAGESEDMERCRKSHPTKGGVRESVVLCGGKGFWGIVRMGVGGYREFAASSCGCMPKRIENPTLVGCKWFGLENSLLAGLSFTFGGI